jgi:hypothetical protein
LNLKEIFGVDVSDNEALKLAMAEALLTKMLDKTAEGKSRTGKGFRKYSKAYMKSDEFKAAGKTAKVNMKLSGDMLGLIDVTSETKNTVTLGWSEGDEGAKAHGHITGGGRLPVRDFFGLNNKDIAEVKKEFSSEISDIKNSRTTERQRAILALIDKIEGSDGES